MRTAAIAIFALVCCFSAVHFIFMVRSYTYGGPDIDSEQARYAALRPYLPSTGKVGYETDNADSGLRKYFVAQYALCPLVVDKDGQHEYVIRERGGVIEVIRRPQVEE